MGNDNITLNEEVKQKSVRVYSVGDTMSLTIAHCVNQHIALAKMSGKIVKRCRLLCTDVLYTILRHANMLRAKFESKLSNPSFVPKLEKEWS
jgi:translation initiation factor IF-1